MNNRILQISGIIAVFLFFTVHAEEYFLRQPEPPQNVEEAATYQAYLTRGFIADLDVEHRLLLEHFIKDTQRKKSGYERLRNLEKLGSLNINNPFVDGAFSDISICIIRILKRTIRIFDVLIPTMNLLHNYFETLEKLSEGASLAVFQALHRTFLVSVKLYASQLYREGLWYWNRKRTEAGYREIALRHFQIAQGLLFRMKDFDSEALDLYNTLDELEPSKFHAELERMGKVARGQTEELLPGVGLP